MNFNYIVPPEKLAYLFKEQCLNKVDSGQIKSYKLDSFYHDKENGKVILNQTIKFIEPTEFITIKFEV